MSMHKEDYVALVREYPFVAMAVAAVVGFLIGLPF